jgi:acetoin utilization deacetylase AcuC-like enzyme
VVLLRDLVCANNYHSRQKLGPTIMLLLALLGAAEAHVVTLYSSDICLGHNPGARGKRPDGSPNVHPEQVGRLERLLSAARGPWAAAFGDAVRIVDDREADVTEEQLLRVHTREHLDRVNYMFAQAQRRPYMRVNLDRDTVLSQGSQAAATRAAGLVVAAVDDMLAPEYPRDSERTLRSFVMVRPPGHHAEAGKAGGFCVYNNVLVGVAHAQSVYGIGRVAILDFDVCRTCLT